MDFDNRRKLQFSTDYFCWYCYNYYYYYNYYNYYYYYYYYYYYNFYSWYGSSGYGDYYEDITGPTRTIQQGFGFQYTLSNEYPLDESYCDAPTDACTL